jgi:hypothetical protein
MATLNSVVKKEIRKQAKISGAHIGYIEHAVKIQFPSVNFEEFRQFAIDEKMKFAAKK